jgi:hypothetical protein
MRRGQRRLEQSITGVVVGIREAPDGWSCAISRTTWIRLPVAAPDFAARLVGQRVRVVVASAGESRSATALALERLPWPSAADLWRRWGRRMAWPEDKWWELGLPIWQVLAATRAGHVIRQCRGRLASAVPSILRNPFAWAARAKLPALTRLPFGVIDAIARRLCPAWRWPTS